MLVDDFYAEQNKGKYEVGTFVYNARLSSVYTHKNCGKNGISIANIEYTIKNSWSFSEI